MIAKLIRQLESKWILCSMGMLFRIALEVSYTDFVHPIYEYAGFELISNSAKYIESWIIFLLLLISLPGKAQRPSDYLLCVAFFVFMVPLLVFYGFADPSRWILYCVVLQYVLISLIRIGRYNLVVAAPRYGPKIARLLCVTIILSATVWMLATAGLSNFNLDLDAVYDFREEANEVIYSGLMGYVVVWATTVAGPFLMMIALREQRWGLVIGVMLLHVFWFGVSSHKSVLFYPMLVISLYTLFKYSRAMSLVPTGMFFVIAASLVSFYATESLFLSGMFIRRVFFVPSHLTITYFEFFNSHEFVYWSNSILSWVISYPYEESVALVIGNHLNDPTLWANNSFFSTGYMHAGIAGVVLYGLVTGMLLNLLDSLQAKGIPLWMSLSLVIVPFNTLFTSADLTTTLLTHGLGLGIFVLYLMGGKTAHTKNENPTKTASNSGNRLALKTTHIV